MVINGTGPYCYSCDKIAKAQDCDRIVQCTANEMCYSQRLLGSNVKEFYKLGCTDRDLCQKQSFSLFGGGMFAGKKREVPHAIASAHALSSRQAQDEMLLCYQCCDGDECNNNLCGAKQDSTGLTRCFECDKVDDPTSCDRIVECGEYNFCYVHYGPIHTNFQYRYDMGCMPDAQCNAMAMAYQNTGCMKCCTGEDYCNFDACANFTLTTTSSPTTTEVTQAPTTPTTTTTTAAPTTPPIPPNVTIVTLDPQHPLNQTSFGSKVSAQCSSDNGVTVKWVFNASSVLPDGVRAYDNGTLTIEKLNETNAGKYKCVAISQLGALSSKEVDVKIWEIPAYAIAILRTPPGSLSPGDKFQLECRVIGYPEPTITWQHANTDGTLIVPGDVTFSNHDLFLTIGQYVPAHHDGVWSCTATNIYGHSSAVGHVP